MELLDRQGILEAKEMLSTLPSPIMLEGADFDALFPTLECVRGYRIHGDTVAEVAELTKVGLPDVTGAGAILACYVCSDLRLMELEVLDSAFGKPQRWKRGMVWSRLPHGRITVYVFCGETPESGKER